MKLVARYRVWDLYWISTKYANQPRQNSNQELTKLDSRVTVAVMVVQIKATKPITVLPAKAKSRQPGKSVRTRQAQSDILLTPSQFLTIRGSGTSAQRKLYDCVFSPTLLHMSNILHLLATASHMWQNSPYANLHVSPAQKQERAAEDCERVPSVHYPDRENFDRKPGGSWISTGM